jgi:methylated-DNA-[protein]-cysteine S-methyltransferase
MRLAYHVMSSPLGLLFLARTERGLRYLEFMDRKSLKRMISAHEAEHPGAKWEPSLLELKKYVDQLDDYFSGNRTEFTAPLDPIGSEFQMQVWSVLRRIPYGETVSYAEIARQIGQPQAARAVGLANNQNPLAIVVPCHRVIGADGSMTGYGGGLPRKRWLLDHETRVAKPVGRTLNLFSPPAAVPLARREAEVAAVAKGAAVANARAAKSLLAEQERQAKLRAERELVKMRAEEERREKVRAEQLRLAKARAEQERVSKAAALMRGAAKSSTSRTGAGTARSSATKGRAKVSAKKPAVRAVARASGARTRPAASGGRTPSRANSRAAGSRRGSGRRSAK